MILASLRKKFMFCRICLFVLVSAVPALTVFAAVNPFPVTTVSAASYEQTLVTPESLVSAFGTQLATTTASATDTDPTAAGIQLPTILAGTTVRVNGRLAVLLFASPQQINYVIPAETETQASDSSPRYVTIEVTSGNNTISMGSVWVVRAAPSIFTANADGKGVLAAEVVRVKADGTQRLESLMQVDAATGRMVVKPFSLGPVDERVFLQIYLTGIRFAADKNRDGNVNESVRVLLGGRPLPPPAYAGKQPEFIGLDQVNIEIPRTLNFLYHERNKLSLAIHVADPSYLYFPATSNIVELEMDSGRRGSAPPVIKSFSPAAVSIGDTLTIEGEQFLSDPTENRVYINGYKADLISASPTQLKAIVPVGVEKGKLRVFTLAGGGSVTESIEDVMIRPSISGIVEDNNPTAQPLRGVKVKVLGTNISTETNSEGAFILKDIPVGKVELEFDPSALLTSAPFPKLKYGLQVKAGRDNQLPTPVTLQAASGAFGLLGAITANVSDTLKLTAGRFTLEMPTNAAVAVEDGLMAKAITLNEIELSRLSVDLPPEANLGFVVQIAPYQAKIEGGAKLTFAGPSYALYRLDQTAGSLTLGQFIKVGEPSFPASWTIFETGCYAAFGRQSSLPGATRIGSVVDVTSGGSLEGIKGALTRSRGKSFITDGTGSLILREADFRIEARYLRFGKQGMKVERFIKEGPAAAEIPGLFQLDPNIIFKPENLPPVLLAPNTIMVRAGETREFDLLAYDPERALIESVSITSGANTSIASVLAGENGHYKLRVAPPINLAGTYQWVLTADAKLGGSKSVNIAVTISTNATAPSLVVPPAQTIASGQSVFFQVTASDPDPDQAVAISVAGVPLGATFDSFINPPNGIFNWTPDHTQLGTYTLTFTVKDSGIPPLSTTKQVTITVVQGNRKPVLTAATEAYPAVGYPMKITVSATDPDANQSLLLAATALPAGATFKQIGSGASVSGTIEWMPTNPVNTNYLITLTATDDGSPQLSESQTMLLIVGDPQKQWVHVQGDLLPVQPGSDIWVDGARLWLARAGVFLSTDGGASWVKRVGLEAFNLPFNTAGAVSDIFKVEDTLYVQAYVGSTNRFFYSIDEGFTWQERKLDFGIVGRLIDGARIIAGASDGIYYSFDKGRIWKKSLGLPTTGFRVLAQVGKDYYATTQNNLYLSTDNGVTWEMFAQSPSTGWITSLLEKDRKFYASSYEGVYVSSDKGLTWTNIKSNLQSLDANAINVSSLFSQSGALYACTAGGIYRYDELTGQWSSFTEGIAGRVVYSIVSTGGNFVARAATGYYFRKSP